MFSMKVVRTSVSVVLAIVGAGLPLLGIAAWEAPEPDVSTSVRNVTTEPLRDLHEQALRAEDPTDAALEDKRALKLLEDGRDPVREIPRYDRLFPEVEPPTRPVDPVVQDSALPDGLTPGMPATEQNFEGMQNIWGVLPPDTDGDVGPNHYVQMVNLGLAVWDKSGNMLLGPVNSNTLWGPLGGICATNNDGDPIVLYDQGADRWLISQFALAFPNNFHECIAISQTGDPTGSWHLYDFLASTTEMNDYPKFGIWPDAYYMSANDFDGITLDYRGVSAYAFERDKMLSGLPAQMIRFDLTEFDEPWAMLPADWDGPTAPPPGAPNPFVYMRDDALGYPADALEIWEFHADWVTPANSTFSFGVNLPTAGFDSNLCGYARNCIPQPAGIPVDAISDRLMFRNQYRNFGTHEAMVLNHTVDENSADHAGVRWYELRDAGGGWAIQQQGTYAPDANHRWMGSIAMDRLGNIALGYSLSSASVHPSIGYTGRLAGDPLGTLPQGEEILIAGGGSQFNSSGRWGDYSAMAVDPVDDCTFWYTQEYYSVDSNATWQTRIGSFRFPGCVSGPTGSLQGTVTVDGSGAPIPGAQITADGSVTFTNAGGEYAFSSLPVGIYDMTASAYGYVPAAVSGVTVVDGVTTTQDFSLLLAPRVDVCGTVTDGSGQGWPLYARIDITASGPVGPVFTDPISGDYCVELIEGEDYTFEVNAEAGGYLPETRSFTAGPATATQDFALLIDELACSAPGYFNISGISTNFDEGIFPPTGWSVVDNAGTGVTWMTSDAWGDGNFTGGTGLAADANSDKSGIVEYDTELVTPEIPSAATGLSYLANYQDIGSNDLLDLDISTDGGTTWSNVLRWNEDHGGFYGLPGEQVSVDLAPFIGGASSYRLRWHYYNPSVGEWDWYAQIDDVQAGTCDPIPAGGLVTGHVRDANTGLAVNGATVQDTLGHVATSFATTDDAARGDGFYVLFSLAGTQALTATAPNYGEAVASVSVVGGAVVTRSFVLPAAWFEHVPPVMELLNSPPGPLQQEPSDTRIQWANLNNIGTLAAGYRIVEIEGPYVAPAVTGPFAGNSRRVSPKHLLDPDARGVYTVDTPAADLLAAGDVVQVWPTGLAGPWGIGYNTTNSDLWVGDISSLAGTDRNYRFLTDGTITGDSIDVTGWVAVFAADMAYNPITDRLWQVNVGGDNCIYELDPVSKVATGSSICPPFGTSERGLAYDPTTDTFYAGSWNDGVINHFAPDGTILDSAFVGLSISGLAYNPSTRHLFVMTNSSSSSSNDVYVLDAVPGYPVIGAFDIVGLGDFEQAGLEMDCAGNLWAVNQATQQVIVAESGEAGGCIGVPWLWVTPDQLTVPAGSTQLLAYLTVADDLVPGLYEAHLRIVNEGPYGDLIVPVNLTVTDTVADNDGDGIPNYLDPDDDNDGVLDEDDAFPFDPSEWADNDRDAIGDNADDDDDNDGLKDWEDPCPFDPRPSCYLLSVNTIACTVTSDPPGIDCGTDCDEGYLEGTVVTLTATPSPGCGFAGWSGACVGTGTCGLTVTDNLEVTAGCLCEPLRPWRHVLPLP